jgi:hypothetical protein
MKEKRLELQKLFKNDFIFYSLFFIKNRKLKRVKKTY